MSVKRSSMVVNYIIKGCFQKAGNSDAGCHCLYTADEGKLIWKLIYNYVVYALSSFFFFSWWAKKKSLSYKTQLYYFALCAFFDMNDYESHYITIISIRQCNRLP